MRVKCLSEFKKMCLHLAVMLAVIVTIYSLDFVFGHGMLIDPPNRSSVWRFYPGFPINYNDNQNFCGGYSVSMHTLLVLS